jgi:mono/diheme cytochrome c family protein
MAGLSLKTAPRAGAGIPLVLLSLVLLPGCNTDGYSDDMTYPLRTDPIVEKTPETQPAHLDPPGQLAQWIATLPERKGTLLETTKVDASQRAQLGQALEKMFGTPAHPQVKDVLDDPDDLKEARLDDATLAEGSRLFRQHCLHCHGLTGDGRGPTGPWVNPHPRDYRQGAFKFTSTVGGNDRKPVREDLLRTLRQGVEGTSMPTFGLLPEEQLQALVSYVIHLSLRGQAEFDTMRALLDGSFPGDTGVGDFASERAQFIWKNQWKRSEKRRLVPPKPKDLSAEEMRASVARGYKQFLTGTAKCVQCHNDFGRANDYRYDVWGTIVRPANLTAGVYRGGRRPVDLYWRIATGIKPSGMPDFADSLQPNDIWDIVHFLQSLPYPAMLPEDPENIQEQVYGKER